MLSISASFNAFGRAASVLVVGLLALGLKLVWQHGLSLFEFVVSQCL